MVLRGSTYSDVTGTPIPLQSNVSILQNQKVALLTSTANTPVESQQVKAFMQDRASQRPSSSALSLTNIPRQIILVSSVVEENGKSMEHWHSLSQKIVSIFFFFTWILWTKNQIGLSVLVAMATTSPQTNLNKTKLRKDKNVKNGHFWNHEHIICIKRAECAQCLWTWRQSVVPNDAPRDFGPQVAFWVSQVSDTCHQAVRERNIGP